MGWRGQPHAPAASTPVKDPVPIAQEVGWAPGQVWTGGKSRPHRHSIPDRSGTVTRRKLPFVYSKRHNYVTLQPEVISGTCHVLSRSCRVTLHTLLSQYLNNFIILCPLHFSVYCNFTCKYALTSRILHLVQILLIWL